MKTLIALLLLAGVANAQSLTVTPEPQITVEMKTATPINVAVVNGPKPNARDYVALYLPGASAYFVWSYLNDGRNAASRPAKGMAIGAIKFLNLKPGRYDAKLFSLTDAGVSTQLKTWPVVVELTTIELDWPGVTVTRKPTNDSDQVNIVFEQGKASVLAPRDTQVVVTQAATP